jgi:hypothetical protein
MQENKEDLKWYQDYRKQILGIRDEVYHPKKKFFRKKKNIDNKKPLR